MPSVEDPTMAFASPSLPAELAQVTSGIYLRGTCIYFVTTPTKLLVISGTYNTLYSVSLCSSVNASSSILISILSTQCYFQKLIVKCAGLYICLHGLICMPHAVPCHLLRAAEDTLTAHAPKPCMCICTIYRSAF